MVFENPEGFFDETQLAESEYENVERLGRELGAVERLENGRTECAVLARVLEVMFGEERGFGEGVGRREDVDYGVCIRS